MKVKIYKSKGIISFLCAFVACFIACISLFGNINGTQFYAAHADEAAPQTEMRVVGYLPTWSYQAYKNIDFSALTHVNISFCNVGSNGEISSGIPDGEMNAIVEKAHENNVKIMAALGGGGYGDPYRDLISSTAKINSLNEKIIAFCEKYDLDGIDLDIELDSSDRIWNDYGEWVSALRIICDERGWLLSTATAQWVAGNTTPETFALFDYVNVMAYDNSSRSESSHASYEFSVECLNYFHSQKSVPKEKLVLGVPFYGRGYDSSGNLDWDSYLSFAELVNANAANYNLDVYNGVAYNGATTMRKKCELAKDYGGIMIWEITLDAEGEYSLLSLIKEELLPAIQEPNAQTGDGQTGNQDIIEPIVVTVLVVVSVILVSGLAVILVKRKRKGGK